MPMPSSIKPASIMGLSATGLALWMMKSRYDDNVGRWQNQSDAIESRNTYDLMKLNRGLYNGVGMEGLVSNYHYLTTNGPMDVFLNFQQMMVTVKGLLNDVLIAPLVGLAAAGLYAAGLKPHQWVGSAGRAVWGSGALQAVGRGIRSLAQSVGFGFVRTATQFLVRMGWKSVPLIAGAAFFGHQFSRALSGDQTRSLFFADVYERARPAP